MEQSFLDSFVAKAAGEMNLGGYLVPSINAPIILFDELKDRMLEGDAPFAIMYWDEPEGRQFILFSKPEDGRVDLGEFVKPFQGKGNHVMAAFKAPPQRDLAGEFIPLALEFPPDDLQVLGLFPNEGGMVVADIYHEKDGQFEEYYQGTPIAWAYMPELPDGLTNSQ